MAWPLPGEGERAKQRDVDTRDPVDRARLDEPARECGAAFIGPTVCDDDGPTPILNSSKTLIIAQASSRCRLSERQQEDTSSI